MGHCIEGRAGAAKITTVAAIREFAEESDYAVRGFAPTTRVVKVLAEAGVSARTVASLIESPLQQTDGKELWSARVLVVNPANEERRHLNAVIRQALKERGLIDTQEVAHAILVNRDLTRSRRGHAQNYEVGNVVRFTRGSRRMEIEKGAYAVVERADSDAGRLLVVLNDGRRLDYSPKRLSGVEVFRSEQRRVAPSDRIQFRAPERAFKFANGDSQRSSQSMDRWSEFAPMMGAWSKPMQTVYATSIAATPRPLSQSKVQPSIA